MNDCVHQHVIYPLSGQLRSPGLLPQQARFEFVIRRMIANPDLQQGAEEIVTPHIAWASQAARQRLLAEIVENIEAFQRGKPRNVIRPAASGAP